MDPRTVIAQRIDLKLRHQLGEGVDAQRTLSDERHARDVLLVCDAMKDTDLPVLARQFRAAGELMAREHRTGREPGPSQDWAEDTSGFGVSRPPVVAVPPLARSSTFGPVSRFLPSRWLS
jgi:hypothetical protein